MNVTGVPIALHAATTLGRAFGPMYEAPARLRAQVESGKPWEIAGTPDAGQFTVVSDRLATAACYVAAALVDEGVGTIEDTDIGARVGLRWRRGPFELMNHVGIDARQGSRRGVCARAGTCPCRRRSTARLGAATPFRFTLVRSRNRRRDRDADHQSSRRDERAQRRGRRAAGRGIPLRRGDPAVKGIVIAGSGKAFVAGADIRFFVRHIEAGTVDAHRGVHQARPGAPPRVRNVRQAGHRASSWTGARRRRRARACLPRDRRHTEGVAGVPGDRHRHLSRARRHAADDRVASGPGLAKWLVLSGQMVGADEALAIGLVDKVVPYEQLDTAIAEAIASARATDRAPRPRSRQLSSDRRLLRSTRRRRDARRPD